MGNTATSCCKVFCVLDRKHVVNKLTITTSQVQYSVQCVENAEAEEAIVVFGSESFPYNFHFTGHPKVSVQCVEDLEGFF